MLYCIVLSERQRIRQHKDSSLVPSRGDLNERLQMLENRAWLHVNE